MLKPHISPRRERESNYMCLASLFENYDYEDLKSQPTCEAANASFSRPVSYRFFAFNVVSCFLVMSVLKAVISSRYDVGVM